MSFTVGVSDTCDPSTSKRSFHALYSVNTNLRSTMAQQKPNSLMLFHVYKECTNLLNPTEIANEFVNDAPPF